MSPDDYEYEETTGLFSTRAGGVSIDPANITIDPVTGEVLVDPSKIRIVIEGTV